MKKTKTREAIKKLFVEKNSPLTANDIYKELKDQNITLSTIYRTLDTFEESGLIKRDVSLHKKEAIFTLKELEHGHILECIKCHKRIYLDYCPFHEVNEEIQEKTGFALEDENHILYGICKSCNNK